MSSSRSSSSGASHRVTDGEATVYLHWVRATWAGWLLGIPLLVLMALVGEALGIGGVQVIVGAGMGTGVGLLQARALRRLHPSTTSWFWSCVGGLGAPFLAVDAAIALGWTPPYSLPASVALGGLLAGTWQSLLLRARYHRVRWWIPASALGWTLGGGMAAGADMLVRSQQLRGVWGALVYLGLVAVGGLVLGVVMGAALVQIVRPSGSRTAEPTAS